MTSKIVADADFDVLMTGDERYPIIGDADLSVGTLLAIDHIQERFKGLPLYAGCLEKAYLTQQILGGKIVTGALVILSGDLQSAYGFAFNPPLECHCWVEYKKVIIDLSLPGVIMRGIKTCDEVGPYLVGREPVALVGHCPSWIKYQPKQIVNINFTRRQNG